MARYYDASWQRTMKCGDPDKLGAYYSLYTAIVKVIHVLAPIAPHITEEIYENLVLGVDSGVNESIHLNDWVYDEELIDTELEAKMDSVREVIEAAARARDVARYKICLLLRFR